MGKGYGIGRYIEELVTHLADVDTEHTFVLFVSKDSAFSCQDSRFELHQVDIPWYSLTEQLKMPRVIKRAKVDLMHFPHWNVPVRYKGSYVVTIHDLTMFHHPRPEATTRGPVVYAVKDLIHRLVVRHPVLQARRVITVSDWVKQDVIKTFDADAEKIDVIYESPTEQISNSEGRSSNIEGGYDQGTSAFNIQDSNFNIQSPYVLYVGSAYPHKNLKTLLQAWQLVEQQLGEQASDLANISLIFAGKPSTFYDRLISSYAWQACERAQHIGFVPDELLPSLYAGAELFVFPSRSEGFGLPPLEAMQAGTPVVASTATCLPEVLGEAALYADPESPEMMAAAIVRGLQNPDLRRDLVRAGTVQVQQYQASAQTEQVLAVYNAVL